MACTHIPSPLGSIKWYRDGREFFGFIPRLGGGKARRFFPLEGVALDVSSAMMKIQGNKAVPELGWANIDLCCSNILLGENIDP